VNEPITLAVEEADALDVLQDLNAGSGVEAAFAEAEPTYDENREHPLYSLDFGTFVELAVALTGLTGGLTTLTTALLSYRSKKLGQAQDGGSQPAAVTIYINSQQVQLTAVDTSASLEEKLRGCLQPGGAGGG
jgi:hypothetical protein